MKRHLILGTIAAALLVGCVHFIRYAKAHRRSARDALVIDDEIAQLAIEVFESEVDSLDWLTRPNPMLERKTPLEVAQNSSGVQRVISILMAIKYGGVV